MAGDWIKMRTNLWDDPRVARLCDLTDQGEAAIVGGLYWLWSAADQHSEDGIMPGLTIKAINRKTGIQSFGEALQSVGWLFDHPEGIRIARFEEHNGSSAKRRSMEAQRKAASRTTSVPDADKERTESGHRAELEKRREEETDRQTDAPVPESLTVGGIMQTCIEAGARLNPSDLHVRQVASEIVSIGATAEDLREAIRKAQLAKQGKAWGLPYVRVIVGEVVEKRKNLPTGGPERPAGGNGEAGGANRKLSLGERATLARQQAEAAEAQREAHGEPLGAYEPPLRAQVVERVR